MKISPLNITTFEITEVHALDPIRVFMQDFGKGQGRLIIECYGRAWSNFWSAMGTDLRTFLLAADADYIENALQYGQNPKKMDREYLQRIVKALQAALREASPENAQPKAGKRTLEDAIGDAEEDLPDNWMIRIEIMENCCSVVAERPDLSEVEMDDGEMDIVEQVMAARRLAHDETASAKLSSEND
jgi:hypothetical protein